MFLDSGEPGQCPGLRFIIQFMYSLLPFLPHRAPVGTLRTVPCWALRMPSAPQSRLGALSGTPELVGKADTEDTTELALENE